MKAEEFDLVVEKVQTKCRSVLGKKADHYAGEEDRLENFVRAGELQGGTPADACFGMLSKHLVSIAMMLEYEEPANMKQWDEKIIDAVNYLILLKACLIDMGIE